MKGGFETDTFLLVIFSGLIVESVWETLKMVWQDGKLSIDRIGSLIVGVVIALTWPIDLFAVVGHAFAYPIVGIILTGIIISRGANFVHDILKSIGEFAGSR